MSRLSGASLVGFGLLAMVGAVAKGCGTADPVTVPPSTVSKPGSYQQTKTPTPTATPSTPTASPDCAVLRVVDGDTVDIDCGAGKVRVRLVGINTPEVYGGVQCYGRQASAEAKKLLTGARVQLDPDPTQDKLDRYGRTLGYLSIGGRDFGEQMLEAGAARVYVYQGHKFELLSRYQRAQRLAEARHAGLWGEC
jgi:micrococcal nuclease